MITPQEKEILSQLPHTQFGVVLKKYLTEELEDIKDVTKSESWDDALARKKAVKVIEKLFNFMGEIKKVDKEKKVYE